MSTLSVIISSPTLNPQKFTLELGSQCSVLEVKEIITTRLGGVVMMTDQRLIFGGRILEDKDTLASIFEKIDCSEITPTLHLVVSPRQNTPSVTPSPILKATTTTPITSTTTPFTILSEPRVGSATTTTTANNNFPYLRFTSQFPMNHQDSFNYNTEGQSPAQSMETDSGLPSSSFTSTPYPGAMLNQPMQYAVINGMPYLVPAAYLPLLMHQHNLHHVLSQYGAYMPNPSFHPAPGGQAAATTNGSPAAVAPAPELNAQEIAARDQRRAASLWLLMKLAFGVYLFSQNGSIERILLLHIAALVIFLQQTGRLRIVRRIGNLPPGDVPQAPVPNAAPNAAANTTQTQQNTTTTTTTTTTSYTEGDNELLNNTQRSTFSVNSQDTSLENDGVGGSNGSASSQTFSPSSSSSSSSSSSTSSGPQGSSVASGVSTGATDTLRHRHPQAQQNQSQETEEQILLQNEPRGSAWRSINHALLTFVTSLVPAPPPEIDQAVANAAAAGERGM
ncbi:hypothetical protein BGZ76_008911 [Entomortierella beljakovae]|nr:hypothetical protein BGZ76_008911 [Entomortierella beljakovae]